MISRKQFPDKHLYFLSISLVLNEIILQFACPARLFAILPHMTVSMTKVLLSPEMAHDITVATMNVSWGERKESDFIFK